MKGLRSWKYAAGLLLTVGMLFALPVQAAEETPGTETVTTPDPAVTTPAETPVLTPTPAPVKKHKTVYKGKNYSRVYDYDYYSTVTCPSLKGKSDLKVLAHFVKKGIPKGARGNKDFDVKSYYNQNPDLRWKYGRNWEKYYRYYQKKGYKDGPVAKCKKLLNPITWYKKNGKKISLKKIYDFEYFTKNNDEAYSFWKTHDDAGAIKYFVKTGMLHGMSGNETYDPLSAKYQRYVKKFHPDYKKAAFYYAQQYSGSNGWLIVINQAEHEVSVFNGSQNDWHLVRRFYCSIGKPSTPTVTGVFHTYEKGLYFVSDSSRCWYYTRFYFGYMLHSVLYWESSPDTLQDGTLKANISHGCVRLPRTEAKWLYDNVPLGATVVSYNRPF